MRLSYPSASQVPRLRAVDGYMNNKDSHWPIITNNTLTTPGQRFQTRRHVIASQVQTGG